MPAPGNRRSKQLPPPRSTGEAAERIRSGTIKMFDRGDGEAADWPILAQVLFEAAFSMIDKQPETERTRLVLEHVEAELYDRMAGNRTENPIAPLGFTAAPTLDNTGMRPARAPQPRLKP